LELEQKAFVKDSDTKAVELNLIRVKTRLRRAGEIVAELLVANEALPS